MRRLLAVLGAGFLLSGGLGGLALAQDAGPPAEAPEPAESCIYEHRAMMALDLREFDNPVSGWRSMAQRFGCVAVAADLIRDWRATNDPGSDYLRWREGELRLELGQTARAVDLFDGARLPVDRGGWNIYLDAVIAFARQDRPALEAARRKLASMPPAAARLQSVRTDGGGGRADLPANLRRVEAMAACFDRPYGEAISEACYARAEVLRDLAPTLAER